MRTYLYTFRIFSYQGSSKSKIKSWGTKNTFLRFIYFYVPRKNTYPILNNKFWSKVTAIENKLGERGRVLIRPSGTEPLIRIMVESEKEEDSEDYCNRLANLASKL